MPYQYQGHTVYWLGEDGYGLPNQGIQNYEEIKKSCKESKTLWEDPLFGPGRTSLSLFASHGSDVEYRVTEWKRPKEIDFVKNPSFIHEGVHKYDARQGFISDCWLVTAISGLTLLPEKYFQMVVPDNQDFEDNYAGIFHFRIWQYGRWVDVSVDDRLPVGFYELAFVNSTAENEFWSALLEKAYAKLHGSYEALEWGAPMESMEDFTGGVTEFYDFKSNKIEKPKFFKLLYKAFHNKAMMILSTEGNLSRGQLNGLKDGHAYLVLDVQYVNTSDGIKSLLQLRNPYGDRSSNEWWGAWSDKSEDWKKVDDKEKERIGFNAGDDGEFWMCWEDVIKYFLSIEVCSIDIGYSTKTPLETTQQWHLTERVGEWVRWETDGGNNMNDSFYRNPQFRLKISEVDEDNSISLRECEGKGCTLIISLMQNRRNLPRLKSRKFWEIGFVIYKLEGTENSNQLDLEFFNSHLAEYYTYSGDTQFREQTKRVSLPPGEYCLVPSTYYPHQGCEFLLRILSQKSIVVTDPDKTYLEKAKMVREETKSLFMEFVGDIKDEMDWKKLKSLLDCKLEKGDCNLPKGQTPGGASKRKRSIEDNNVVITSEEFFSMELCRTLIALYDINHSAHIGIDEFHDLWIDVLHWKDVFKSNSKENPGYLNRAELGTALKSAGFELSNHLIEILANRYNSWNDQVSFNDFLVCATRMMKYMETFNGLYGHQKKEITMTRKDYLENSLYP